jgi:hypothetical protein
MRRNSIDLDNMNLEKKKKLESENLRFFMKYWDEYNGEIRDILVEEYCNLLI